MKFGQILAIIWISLSTSVFADEGMWLLNDFPAAKVKQKYGFSADQKWLDHVRLSSARLARGCSGSFVSKDGLVMTNHHCAHDCIEQLSRSGKDFVADGFYAKTHADEVKCPEMEINQLTAINDVSSDISKNTQGLDGAKFNDALKAATARLEKECSKGSEDVRCEVVSLFHGGKYHLYRYKRFQDVRLVFAPEFAIAFFGGDPDNFNFPRYDLDLSFVRVYDKGQPLKADHHFQWSKTAAKEGDLTFVTGHPGRTSRLLTIAQLETQRDLQLIRNITGLSELRGFLTEFQNRGAEQKRISNDKLFGIENSLKAMKGKLGALLNPDFFNQKKTEEAALIRKIQGNASWKKEYGSAWSEIEKAEVQFRDLYTALSQLEYNRDFHSKLYNIAKTLVRATAEFEKPNEKRLKEFTESKIPEMKQLLFSEAPIYDDLEIALLGFGFTKARENLTADHPIIRKMFAAKSPTALAEHLIKNTRLKDIAYRKRLLEGGVKAVQASEDPLIRFALLIDPETRKVRKKYEDEIESVIKKNSEKIAKASFLARGSDTYPDATFTLRISYGKIEGYQQNGQKVNPVTKIAGAFERHTGYDPFALPRSWINAKSKLKLETPMNFCSTNDIIGGNSGSPVINSRAEVVGLIFDGNIQSLGGDYGFDPSVNRAVAVHSSVILESLNKIYNAERIVTELTGRQK